VDRLIRTILGRNQLKLSLLPPQLRRVIELRFDYQNTRGDTQVAGLLKGSVDEVRAWTLMAFKRMRELGPTDAHRAELDRRLVDHAANPGDVVPWDEVKDSALTRIGRAFSPHRSASRAATVGVLMRRTVSASVSKKHAL
jgi:Putative addiction module component